MLGSVPRNFQGDRCLPVLLCILGIPAEVLASSTLTGEGARSAVSYVSHGNMHGALYLVVLVGLMPLGALCPSKSGLMNKHIVKHTKDSKHNPSKSGLFTNM